VFVNWLYKQKVPETPEEWRLHLGLPENLHWSDDRLGLYHTHINLQKIAQLIIRLVVFAVSFKLHEFHHAVKNAFHDITNEVYNLSNATVVYAFDKLPPDHDLLRVIVESRCRGGIIDRISGKHLPQEGVTNDQLPHDFLVRAFEFYGDEVDRLQMPLMSDPNANTEIEAHNPYFEEGHPQGADPQEYLGQAGGSLWD
jgi:hypothetical protein